MKELRLPKPPDPGKRHSANGSKYEPAVQKKLQLDKQEAKNLAKELFGTGRKALYPTLHKLTANARSGDPVAIASIRKGKTKFQQNRFFHDELANRVRVKATKTPKAKKGYGLDELFKTSETPYFIDWAGGQLQGKEAVSTITDSTGKSRSFTVLDLQELFRLPTALVLTRDGGGHTGAVRETTTSKGYMTTGQAELHAFRQDVIELAVTPAEAAIGALYAHLEMTPNLATIKTSHLSGFDVANRDFSNPSDKTKMDTQFAGTHRDQLKLIYQMLQDTMPTTALFPPASPLHKPQASPPSGGNPLESLRGIKFEDTFEL